MTDDIILSTSIEEITEFQTAKALPVAAGHFFLDIYSAIFPTVLPLIIEKLALTFTQAGWLSALYQLPALIHPVIGYFADKKNLRYLVILTPGISGTLMSLIGLAPNYLTLALFLFGSGLASVAFHSPSPAMVARVSGRKLGLGMGYFMAAGNLAFTVGPLLGVWAVSTWTLEGIYRLSVIGWAASLLLWIQLRHLSAVSEKPGSVGVIRPMLFRLFFPLAMINFFRHFVLEPLSTYLPTYINLGGASLWAAGISFSIVYLAGAIGSLLAGRYSDRLDRKLVLVGTLFASALLLVVFTFVKGWATIPLLFLLGFTANSADPVLLAIVQEQLPNNRSTGNSIYMLFSFAMRPIATLAIGWLGDQAGLQSAFLWGALISLFTLPAVLALPKATK